MSNSISNRFKNARRSAGLTQEEVAELLKVDAMSVQQLESGKKGFTVELIERFCKSVGVSRHYMFLGEGRPMDEPNGTHIDPMQFPDNSQHPSEGEAGTDSFREIA